MDRSDALHLVWFHLGPLGITGSVVFTWMLMVALVGVSWLATRRLNSTPGRLQSMVEGAVLAMDEAVRVVIPEHHRVVMPFISSLWCFVIAANLAGIVPGMNSPTADLSVTSALAVVVFLSVHWFGVRIMGPLEFLRHYLSPTPLLLPFHVIGEITRTIALALRLFGNIMSMEFAALLLLSIAGFLAPIPILMLHIVEALVQAYIFGTLALIYIAGGLASQQHGTS